MKVDTGDKAPSNVVGFLERVLVRSKINDDKQPRFLVGWALGHKNADIITPMEDGSVRYNSSWKYMQTSMKPKVQGCLACEHGMNVNVGRKHTF